jgi:hypothetical protein
MQRATVRPQSLADMPLWRLIVALDDAEQTVGPGSPTARTLARAIQDRLRQQREAPVSRHKEATGAQ